MAGRWSVARFRDWREWQDVHTGLYSKDIYSQQRAISHVAMWRSRGEIPIAINATAQLVEVGMHERMANHQFHTVGGSSRSHMELSLLYASAIVRCVNGLVDCSQKGAYAMAVSALAQRIGIPLWIVDLRHESTHNQLPSLSVLRFAAQHLLAWLESNYWWKQEEAIRAPVRDVAFRLTALCPFLRQQCDAGSTTSTSMTDAGPVSLNVNQVREIVIPLLVHGVHHSESAFPYGIFFLSASVPISTIDAVEWTEVEFTKNYPKEELIQLVLRLQAVWASTSAALVAALTQKIIRDAQLLSEDQDDLRIVHMKIGLIWIKLLVSNEWRERLKYLPEPIDEIYATGSSMLSLCETHLTLSLQAHVIPMPPIAAVTWLERLKGILRACKGIRNHRTYAIHSTLTQEMQVIAPDVIWKQVSVWTACPLGVQYNGSDIDFDGVVEYPLEIDQDTRSFTVGDEIETEEPDQLFEDLDAVYEAQVTNILALQQTVHEHVIHGGKHNGQQTILQPQEVERIQQEIEIW